MGDPWLCDDSDDLTPMTLRTHIAGGVSATVRSRCLPDQRDSTLANAMSQCRLFGYTPQQAAAEVVRVIKVVDGWRGHFAACGVTASDLESLAERIDGPPLLDQRRQFKAADHLAPARSAKRNGPFGR